MPSNITIDNTQKGLRQDLGNAIFEAYGEETPYLTSIAKAGPQSNYTDQHPADTPGSAEEGGVPDNVPAPPPTNQSAGYDIIETNAELWKESVRVGLLAGYFANRAGVVKDGSMPAPQLLKREVIKKLRAMNTVADRELCSSRDQRDPTPEKGMQTRGLGSWISATAQGVRPVPEQFRPDPEQIYNGSWDDFGIDELEDVLQACFDKTGYTGIYDGICGIAFKRRVTGFSVEAVKVEGYENLRRFDEDPTEKRITRTINVIEFDSGTVEFRKSRNLNFSTFSNKAPQTDLAKRTCYLIPKGTMEQAGGFQLLTTQKPIVKDLPDDGGGTSKYAYFIYGNRGNPTGCGKIAPAN